MTASAATTHVVRERVPRASATPFATGLALHALLRPRDDLEPGDGNAIETGDAHAVHTGWYALQRSIDVVDRLARGRRQREVALTLDARRVAFARLFVELGVALLAVGRELLGRCLQL